MDRPDTQVTRVDSYEMVNFNIVKVTFVKWDKILPFFHHKKKKKKKKNLKDKSEKLYAKGAECHVSKLREHKYQKF